MKSLSYGANVFTTLGFLTHDECDGYIRMSEEMEYEIAAIQTQEGPEIIKSVRDNDRVIFDDAELAEFFYKRARSFLPEIYGSEWQLVGLNERFRFYRYSQGQYFKWHQDGTYCRSDEEMSQLSFLIYLNDGFVGGETQFAWDTIKPEAGMVLWFPHRIRHQGKPIQAGCKYILRTDVMYRKIF